MFGDRHVRSSGARADLLPDCSDWASLTGMTLYTPDQEVEVARLVDLGVCVVRTNHDPADDYVVMTDPEGNYFCVCLVPA